LRPHNAAGAVFDQRVVEVLERALAVSRIEIIDIGVTQRATRDRVTADTNPDCQRSDDE
jgi:hypothetical protein